MEMPIQVIIVLFVALAVGGAILLFSQRTLSDARQELIEKWKDDGLESNIIAVRNATDETVLSLARQCAHLKAASPDHAPCFALFADDWQVDFVTLDGTPLEEGIVLNTFDLQGIPASNITGVRITYDPSRHVLVTR